MISSCHSSVRSIAHSSDNTHLTTQDIFPINKTPHTSYDTTHLQDIFPIRNTILATIHIRLSRLPQHFSCPVMEDHNPKNID